MTGKPGSPKRWWMAATVVLALGLLIGAGIGYLAAPRPPPSTEKVLTVDGSEVYLPVLAGPGTDLTFIIGGLVNPTVEVQAGAVVTLYFSNAPATIPHSWGLVAQGPPYGSGHGEDDGDHGEDSETPFPGAETPDAHVGTAPGGNETITFTASTPGTYWYICHVPGHAANGMYGKFVVR